MFFSFDGIDGTGKSTQWKLFCEWLRECGHDVVACRDPGSTALGEKLRAIVLGHDSLDAAKTPIDRRSEMLLYMAARAQLVEEVIRPALEAGRTVISDRFLLANVAYQAYGGGLDVSHVWQVGRIATAGIRPEVTFLLDMPVEATAARMQRALDRMESQGGEFLERVREGFLTEAARDPSIIVIDAARDVEAVQMEIQALAAERLSVHREE